MGTPDANVPGDQGGRIVGLASVANINRLIAYLETLELVGGDHDGKPMVVLPWERRFIRGAFRTPDGDAALSIAHGNGKTQLVSALACASVDPAGPLHVRGGEVLCVGAAFAQGKLIYDDVLKLLGQRYDLNDRKVWRKQDSANNATLEHRETYAKVSCVGGDPALVHGSRARLLLLDEPAQWKPAKAERMVAALEHGLGKSAGSKLVALGTRPVGDGHFFAKMLKTADYAQSHQTGADDPLFQLRTIRKANPSWDHLPSLRSKVMRLMALAKLDETKEASFRALRLNQGTADTYEAVMFDLATWRGVEGEAERVGPYVLAVDTGTNAAMTACAAYFAATGALAVFAVFPSVPSLGERGRRDQVAGLYSDLAEAGELMQFGNRTSDLAETLREARRRWGVPSAVVVDAWRKAELLDALDASGIPSRGVRFAVRRNGPHDGTQDWRAFQRAVLEGRVTPRESRLLRWAMAESRLKTDDAGNAWMAKKAEAGRRQRARDDTVAAAILAVSYARREWGDNPPDAGSNGSGLRLVA